jgi:hypothetical protein
LLSDSFATRRPTLLPALSGLLPPFLPAPDRLLPCFAGRFRVKLEGLAGELAQAKMRLLPLVRRPRTQDADERGDAISYLKKL